MEWWFGLYLLTAEVLGYRIVWTAHDLLPHEQVFADDERARDLLISKARVVIALSEATATELRALGARRVRVIPIGPYAGHYPVTLSRTEARETFGYDGDDVVVALIGRIEEYKGADLLLTAAAKLPNSSKVKLLLAGVCPDESYREKIRGLIGETYGRTVASLQWIPDEDLARYYQAADIAIFPFREITNSASLLLAQSFGKPVMISNLPALDDVPPDTAIRFEPDVNALLGALGRAEHLSESEIQEMGAAGRAWATRFDWSKVARETIDAYEVASLS
jgi:glycosyltransferase involved in cell wall biosynthesis